MIEKLLNRWGYVKETTPKKLTELELLSLLGSYMEDVDTDVNKKGEDLLFKDLQGVEGFLDYLKVTAARDMKRYFSAPSPVEQLTIKGAFSRTNYLRGRVLGEADTQTKLEGTRYI